MKTSIFDIGVICDTGDRKKENEDSILVKTSYVRSQEIGVFVVADGMSSLKDSKNASNLVTDVISFWWEHYFLEMLVNNNTIEEIAKDLDNTIYLINKQLVSQERKQGTTLSLLIWIGDIYIIRHVGDSRIYRINKKITKLTEDHLYVDELLKRGYISKEDPNFYLQRHVLTKCLGIKEKVELYKDMGKSSEEDVFLLCSDGFHGIVHEQDILSVIYDKRIFTMQDKVRKLRSLIKKGDADDNVSVILVKQVENSQYNKTTI